MEDPLTAMETMEVIQMNRSSLTALWWQISKPLISLRLHFLHNDSSTIVLINQYETIPPHLIHHISQPVALLHTQEANWWKEILD